MASVRVAVRVRPINHRLVILILILTFTLKFKLKFLLGLVQLLVTSQPATRSSRSVHRCKQSPPSRLRLLLYPGEIRNTVEVAIKSLLEAHWGTSQYRQSFPS